jgi:hypothetical protein
MDGLIRTVSGTAEQALRRLQDLYVIEAEITGMTADERQKIRREQALPILTDLKSWMTEQRRRLSSKTGLAKALQYALTRWDRQVFTGEGFSEDPC